MAAPTERQIEATTTPMERVGERPIAIDPLLARVIAHLGEDPGRDGLRETPKRWAKFLREATAGYRVDVDALLKTFENDGRYSQMVTVGPIPFYSLCEHHLAPFFGSAWVAYVPGDRIIGLSKLARLTDAYAKRLQVQERLTEEIAEVLWTKPGLAQGVGVMVKARHLCMEMRGVEKAGAFTTTTALRGCFAEQIATREEWLRGCV